MYNIIVFCALVLVLPNDVYSQCNDCINYDRCPEALNLALYKRTPETIQLFKKASCGFDNSGRMPIAKVCCSLFPTPSNSDATKDAAEDIRIANHKNLKYLPDDCGTIKGDRIVGGKISDMYEFPWMALISHETRDGLKFKCGASIINKRYVLTAAHCVKNKKIAGVRVGEYDIESEIDCVKDTCEKHLQDIEVEKSIVHENYKGLPIVINDIALLRLSEDIDFDHRNVHQICLPKTSELRKLAVDNKMATVTGWGITENRTESSVLLKVRIPIHTAQRCSDVYNRFSKPGGKDVTADQLCAGAQNMDSCNGDSGGPLMLEELYGDTYKFIQYGVVSHGPQQCGSEYPGVYTDVRKYMGWILDNMTF